MPDKPVENNANTIENLILAMRGQKVILDSDLARVYGVPTKRLNEQFRRNKARFPSDFVFQLNQTETTLLMRSQIATGSQKHRDPRFKPFVFTEHGAIMPTFHKIFNEVGIVPISIIDL